MTAKDDDDQAHDQPWHHSTSAVAGASAVALGVIALLVWAVVSLTSNANSPEEAPTQFVDPTFSSSAPAASTTTTTATITTTPPVSTSEIMGPSDTATTSGSDTSSSSDTSSTGPSTTGQLPTTRTHAGDAGTSRPRVRTNVTRTLYPLPGN